jgi:hypothetical protein
LRISLADMGRALLGATRALADHHPDPNIGCRVTNLRALRLER